MENLTCHDCKIELQEGDEYMQYELEEGDFKKCRVCFEKDNKLRNFKPTEVYARVCGYIRPKEQWNVGKRAEDNDKKLYKINAEGKNSQA